MENAPLPNTFGIDARALRLLEVDDIDALPAAPWDVPMDALLTERGILRPASPASPPLPCPTKEIPHD